MADGLLGAVRGLRLAHPELGPRPLLAKLREQQPDLAAGNKEVRKALAALKAEESKAPEAAAAAPPAAAAPSAAAVPPAAEEGGEPPNVAIRLACFGCARLPSEMGDGREKHPACEICVKLKVPTTYWCCVNCPGNPGALEKHEVLHKSVKRHRKQNEDGGVTQQQDRESAEAEARYAAETGDPYVELLAEGTRYLFQEDCRRAARAYREAIALKPDQPIAYINLGAALNNSGHHVEAAQRYLEARELDLVGSEGWARATARAFNNLTQEECADVAKPEWWNDKGLKALAARVVRAAPDDLFANEMWAMVLGGLCGACEAVPRSAAELKEAATHFERAAALCPAPAMRAALAGDAVLCRTDAEATLRCSCLSS
jgi:tetratricopeptide (TPR) repeat protein